MKPTDDWTRRLLGGFLAAGTVVLGVFATNVTASVAVMRFDIIPPGSGADPSQVPVGTKDTMGWAFRVQEQLWVTHLGFFDANSDGLAISHRVGIWDVSGSLLVDAVVSPGPGTPFVGQYQYATISPIALHREEVYVIGATASWTYVSEGNPLQVFDPYPTFNVDPVSLVMDPNVDLVSFRRFVASHDATPPLPPGELNFPVLDFPDGYFLAPNFRFDRVPEPACLLLVGTVLAYSLAARREPNSMARTLARRKDRKESLI